MLYSRNHVSRIKAEIALPTMNCSQIYTTQELYIRATICIITDDQNWNYAFSLKKALTPFVPPITSKS